MIKWKKYICVALSAVMMASLATGCGDTNDSSSSDKAEATTESESDTLQDALTSEISKDGASDADKEETVYVLADANGNANDVTVSTWLKNSDGAEGLNDKTNLTDIQNVKGYEEYKDNGDGTITWAANGSDIYYQGKSNEELPVDVKVTYKLDGEEIEPSELAGKSGKVTIRFDYTNNTKKTVTVDSKNTEVISPFVMLSGMILPVDKFSNVQVENGKVISEGSNQIVVGYAVPGFKQCLQDGINDSKIETALDNIDVPDYVEVTADVTDFELSMTMTVAASDLLGSSAEDAIDEVKDKADVSSLTDSVDQLGDSADQLEEGSGKITNGLETLKDGTYSLKKGADTLADGAASLENYTSQLAAGTSQISTAMGTLDDGIKSIKDGSSALNDGAKTLATGAKTVDTSVGTLKKGADDLNKGAKALLAGFEGDGGAVKGAKNLSAGLDTLSTSSQTLAAGADAVNTGIGTLISTLTALPDTAAQSVYDAAGVSSASQIQGLMDKLSPALAMGKTTLDAAEGEGSYDKYMAQYTALAQAQGALNAIDNIKSALNSTDNLSDIKTLTDAAAAVKDGAAQLSAGLGTAATGASSLSSGIGQMYSGTKDISKGLGTLATGASELKKGTKTLSDGAATISTNMNTLYQGSLTLANGSSQLKTAAGTLDSSAGQIAAGAKTLSDGASQLDSGSKTLDDGAKELVTGSKTLSDGMKQFNEEGIKKITKLFAGNYQADIDYIEALFSDDTTYTSFTGTIDGTKSTVKFIYETGAIKSDAEK